MASTSSRLFPVIFFILLSWKFLAVHSENKEFCYADSKKEPSCGYEKWGGYCTAGGQQSPIDIPSCATATRDVLSVNTKLYKTNHFIMTNNGHTVKVDFVKDPANRSRIRWNYLNKHVVSGGAPGIGGGSIGTERSVTYIFNHLHLHWGQSKNRKSPEGSEHSINGRFYAMELHLVHYLSKYGSLNEAVASRDKSALAVLAVMIEQCQDCSSGKSSVLAPIVRHLDQVQNPGSSVNVTRTRLNFTPWLANQKTVYNYQGSLTTPDCNEVVNWFVLQTPAKVSSREVEQFRKLRNHQKKPMLENNRPRQRINNRNLIRAGVNSILNRNERDGCGLKTNQDFLID